MGTTTTTTTKISTTSTSTTTTNPTTTGITSKSNTTEFATTMTGESGNSTTAWEREGRLTNKIEKSFSISKIKFRCIFTLTHTCDDIDTKGQKVVCTPSKPKRQTVKNLKITAKGFDYLVDINVNPTKITKLKMTDKPSSCDPPKTKAPTPPPPTAAPTTAAPTTTSTTSSTTTVTETEGTTRTTTSNSNTTTITATVSA